MVCHGVQEAQRGPILNGMENWYPRDQIEKFRSGVRGAHPPNRSEHLMGIAARSIPNELEAAYLAFWFSTQEPVPAIRTVRGNLELGKELYQRRCVSCHGESGGGNQQLISPSLTHLEGWYFYQQMRKFREGKRGHHPRDEGGRVMAAASQDLSDYDIKNIVAYCIDSFWPARGGTKKAIIIPKAILNFIVCIDCVWLPVSLGCQHHPIVLNEGFRSLGSLQLPFLVGER